MEIVKQHMPQNNIFGQRGFDFASTLSHYIAVSHTDFFVTLSQLSCFFFLHSLHCMINILRQMKTFLVELMTLLPYNMIHQSLGYSWVTLAKVMNAFFYDEPLFSLEPFFWRKLYVSPYFLLY